MNLRKISVLMFLLCGAALWAAAPGNIFVAVQNGNRAAVKRLLAKDKTLVYQQDARGMTPFLEAVFVRDLDMAVLLADAFSRLDANCSQGNAMHLAVLNEDAAMLRVLMQLCDEEDPNLTNSLLNMPRHWGGPQSKTDDGNTPLHLAALKCHRPMYQFLVANGAKPTVRNSRGKTPAQLLKSCPPEPKTPPESPAPSIAAPEKASAAEQAVPEPEPMRTAPTRGPLPAEPLVFPLE